MENKDTQLVRLRDHLLKGWSMNALGCIKLGISGSCFHRRLGDLREGKLDGIRYPIDYGHWVTYGGKRFKVYQMDLTKLPT